MKSVHRAGYRENMHTLGKEEGRESKLNRKTQDLKLYHVKTYVPGQNFFC